MNLFSSIKDTFEIPEGHTAKVLLGGGTQANVFMKSWEGQIPDEMLQKLDEAASIAKLPLNPFLILLLQGEDGHVHAKASLPLVGWKAEIHVEKTVSESNELIRITDWCAGFMQSFCMTGTVVAYDMLTEMLLLGEDNNPAFSIKASVKGTAPKREVRDLASFSDDIGSVDDILGQMSDKDIKRHLTRDLVNGRRDIPIPGVEDVKRVEIKDESPEPVSVPIVNVDAEQKKVQQDIVDKYGMEALKDILSRSKQPLLVDESKV